MTSGATMKFTNESVSIGYCRTILGTGLEISVFQNRVKDPRRGPDSVRSLSVNPRRILPKSPPIYIAGEADKIQPRNITQHNSCPLGGYHTDSKKEGLYGNQRDSSARFAAWSGRSLSCGLTFSAFLVNLSFSNQRSTGTGKRRLDGASTHRIYPVRRRRQEHVQRHLCPDGKNETRLTMNPGANGEYTDNAAAPRYNRDRTVISQYLHEQ